jgi:hypothetical protein
MADTDTNPENEYADDEYADHDAEDLDQPSVSTRIPDEAPEADVLEQRQEVPDDQNEDEPWWDEGEERDQDEIKYDDGE